MKLIEDPSRTPAHCSSCFAQKPQARHVDFEGSWDGPTFIDGEVNNGQAGKVTDAIDELIVCEDCMVEAAALVGLTDNRELEAKLADAEKQLENARERLAGYGQYAEKLEAGLAAKAELAGARS